MPVKARDNLAGYVEVLQSHGVGSEQAKAFKAAHADDAEFQRRATGADRLFEYKDEILKELDRGEKQEQPTNPVLASD